jgi:alpha-tubulin suppressor-like RCC1 family protein
VAVWTWSAGDKGALGRGDDQARSTPTRLDEESFGGSVAVMVACGRCHKVVTADGRLWTFGWGDNGRLGHGDMEDKLIPTLVARGKGQRG